MNIRKVVAVLTTASVAFWAPSIIPIKAAPIGCGLIGQYRTIDTAFATPLLPCPPRPHPGSPWPAFAVIIGTSSVILNAIYIWNSQCRELSSQEAMTSAFLPLIGIAFDAQASKCRR